MSKDPLHPTHRAAREMAFARSNGTCQFCGQYKAREGHHWAMKYPRPEYLSANDLTALCTPCHELATSLRRYGREGNGRWELISVFRRAIRQCFTTSELKDRLRSSRTAPPDSTRYSPSTSRRRRSPASAARTGRKPDDERLRQLEAIGSLWLDDDERPTIPSTAIRSVIETGARKLKQGPQVREGLAVIDTSFTYDVRVYGESLDELSKTCQFTVPVVVQRSRVLRTRAKFDVPWACDFTLSVDDELVQREWLERWLDIGGRRIGLGDWRPEKSGQYGRFTVSSIYMDEEG